MGSTGMLKSVLAVTDLEALPASVATAIFNTVTGAATEGIQQSDPVIITRASSLSSLPMDPSYMDVVICICRSLEFLADHFLKEVFRVMKPNGTILIYGTSQSEAAQLDKAASSLERELLMTGFVEAQTIKINPVVSSESDVALCFVMKAKKTSWDIGSSFSIKRAPKSLPKIHIDDDMDLIDEDSLLSEEDMMKPQLPPAGDCEVGSTRKACRNCTCGRAEAEEKLVKLGPTTDQLLNPQSACGSCGLGDAFRCSTCPYRGLAPFKMGEKVSIPTDFLAADI